MRRRKIFAKWTSWVLTVTHANPNSWANPQIPISPIGLQSKPTSKLFCRRRRRTREIDQFPFDCQSHGEIAIPAEWRSRRGVRFLLPYSRPIPNSKTTFPTSSASHTEHAMFLYVCSESGHWHCWRHQLRQDHHEKKRQSLPLPLQLSPRAN